MSRDEVERIINLLKMERLEVYCVIALAAAVLALELLNYDIFHVGYLIAIFCVIGILVYLAYIGLWRVLKILIKKNEVIQIDKSR